MHSRLLAGSEALAKALKTTVDGQNISFFDAARSAGYANDQDDLSSVFLKEGTYSAFVELHIEQGPILEEEGLPFSFIVLSTVGSNFQISNFIVICQSRYINWHSNCHRSPSKHKGGI